MTYEDWLKLLDILKWPVAALLLGVVLLMLFRSELRALFGGLRERRITLGRAEIAPEQTKQIAHVATAQFAATAASQQSNNNPHPFTLSDNAYLRTVAHDLAENIATINFASPEDRDKWLIREGAGLLIQLDYEKIYRDVWPSQMELLGAAIRLGGTTREAAKRNYDAVAATAPKIYADYTLDQWLKFLESCGLLRCDGLGIYATDKGKLFVQYLVQQGYDLHGLRPGL